MKFFKCISFVVFGFFIGKSSTANQYCACISDTSFLEPGGGYHYIAKCLDKEGNVTNVLEDTNVKTQSDGQNKTRHYMSMYQIKESDCVPLPNGKLKYAPQPTKRLNNQGLK